MSSISVLDDVSPNTSTEVVGQPLVVEHLTVRYGHFEAVSDASVSLPTGRVLGVVGESGSGKTTLALAISRLLPPGASIATGAIRVGAVDVVPLTGDALRRARGELVAYIPQDASAAMNPVRTAGYQLAEVFRVRHRMTKRHAWEAAVSMLASVGIRSASEAARKYPHELSGGMRQRVMIAMAIALRPAILVADEPTTALDVTVQAEIVSLVCDLQREFGTTLVWITHDMGVIAELADDVCVMYGGRVVEHSSALTLFKSPRHPYTRALLNSFTSGRRAAAKEPFETIEGLPPVDVVPPGCPFHPRCPYAEARCSTDLPFPTVLPNGHMVRCHLEKAQ